MEPPFHYISKPNDSLIVKNDNYQRELLARPANIK